MTDADTSAPAPANASSARPRRGRRVKLVALVVILLLAGLLGYMTGLGNSRRVSIINGLPRAYTVQIAGRSIDLPRETRVPVDLPYGRHTLRITGLDHVGPPIELRLETPWWRRPFDKTVIAINPDRTAVLLIERPTDTTPRSLDLFTGRAVHRFADVDQPWNARVGERDTADDSDITADQTRLFIWPDFDVVRTCAMVVNRAEPDLAAAFLRQSATHADDATIYLQFLAGLLEPGPMLEYLTPRLADRPIRIPIHRAYQDLLDRTQPAVDLVGRYESLLDERPDDPARLYLLARIVPDTDRARSLLEAASESDQTGWSHSALAYMALCRGEGQAALRHIRAARAANPDKPLFLQHYRAALQAAGQWQALADHWAAVLRLNPLDAEAATWAAAASIRAGDTQRARQITHTFTTEVRAAGLTDFQRQATPQVEAMAASAAGARDRYIQAIERLELQPWPFRLALMRGRPDEASPMLEAGEARPDPFDDLLVAIVAMEGGERELATRHVERAAERLSQLGRGSRELAAALRGEKPTDADWWRDLELLPDRKRIALTALALRQDDPTRRRALLQFVADKMNHSPRFPHLLIAGVTARPIEPPATNRREPGD